MEAQMRQTMGNQEDCDSDNPNCCFRGILLRAVWYDPELSVSLLASRSARPDDYIFFCG